MNLRYLSYAIINFLLGIVSLLRDDKLNLILGVFAMSLGVYFLMEAAKSQRNEQ